MKEGYPQAVKPLECFLALGWRQMANPLTVLPLAAGYNTLSRLTVGESRGAALCTRDKLLDAVPWLPPQHSRFFRWTECLLDDPQLLATALLDEARRLGAECHSATEVQAVEPAGKALTIVSSTGQVEARTVVDATGPWLGGVAGLPPWPNQQWAAGFNIVVSRQLVKRSAVGVFGSEGRAFFFVPRDGQTAIGTWYEPFAGSPSEPAVGPRQVAVFLDALNRTLPELGLRPDEVTHVEAGVLPAVSLAPRLKLVGRERINVQGRVVQVLSTKFTTFRSQARRVVQELGRLEGF